MTVDYEKQLWNAYYEDILQDKGIQDETTPWWLIADRDAAQLVKELFKDRQEGIKVLEPGCGSGATSFNLSKQIQINELVLLDIASNALKFAQNQEDRGLFGKVKYIEGNIFDLSLFSKQFDLVWNIGLIEHYSVEEIRQIISQMYSAVSPGGFLVIGIPNRKSLTVIKAALLGSTFGERYLSWVKGYRNSSEILYSNRFIQACIRSVTGAPVRIQYGGSPLWVGAPIFLVKFLDRYFKLKPFSFLSFFIVQKPKTSSI